MPELGPPDELCENPNWKSGPYLASLYEVPLLCTKTTLGYRAQWA